MKKIIQLTDFTQRMTDMLATAAVQFSVPSRHFGCGAGRGRRNTLPTMFRHGLVEWVKTGYTVRVTRAGRKLIAGT